MVTCPHGIGQNIIVMEACIRGAYISPPGVQDAESLLVFISLINSG
jgi:hypothetical protein